VDRADRTFMSARPVVAAVRTLAVVALLVLVSLAIPRGSAPPAPRLSHLEVWSGTLVPTTNASRALDFDGAPLEKGWVFLLEAQVQGGSVSAVLMIGSNTAKAWTIPVSSRWYDTMLLPDTGVYNLTLTNPGMTDVSFSIYFDQSCNCAGKAFPATMTAGLLIFNVDVQTPSVVPVEFNKPAAFTVRVTAALLAQGGGRWPGDFTKLAESGTAVRRQADPTLPPVWLYELNVSITQPARVYYFVQALTFIPANNTDEGARTVAPFFPTPTPIRPSISPFVFVAIAVVLAGIGGFVLWRGRRGLPEPEDRPSKKKGGKGKGAKGRKQAAHRAGGRDGSRKRTSQGRSRRS